MEQLDDVETIRLYCGVLPQNPVPPFNYKLTFNVEGLVAEYDYRAVVLRDHEVQEIETLAELELVDMPPLGTLEAFTTSGGTSTAPYTFQGKVRNYEYKTFRFPGHCEKMKLYRDFGLWREDEIDVRGAKVRPKDVFCKVFGDELAKIQDEDQCVIRATAWGRRDGVPVVLNADIYDRQDPATGFTSMERLTGFSLSIVAQHVTAGKTGPGACPYELAMKGTDFVAELERREISVRVH
jgi:lysine 6-dehydrogenase